MSRAAIFDTLEALLRTVPGVVGVSTKPRRHEHVKPEEMPLILLLPNVEDTGRRVGGANAPVLRPDLVVYVAEDEADDGRGAGRVLQDVLDALDAKLAGSPLTDGRQTLGGLVHDCFVAGTIETDAGEWGAKAGAVLPLEIHVHG
jgi:hypothetical protein